MEGQDRRRVGIFEDDEIPYEVRMKHLIEAYRKDITRLEQLTRYAKGLEEENLLLQKKIKKSEEWLMGNPDKEALIRQMDLEIRFLKGTLTKSFPKRIVELKYIKRKVRDLEEYTLYLQDLLSANDVPYAKREPNESYSGRCFVLSAPPELCGLWYGENSVQCRCGCQISGAGAARS